MSSPSSSEKVNFDDHTDQKDDVSSTLSSSFDVSSMTEKEKYALYRKMDWHLLPILAVLFTMSFVFVSLSFSIADGTYYWDRCRDRGNIGVCRIFLFSGQNLSHFVALRMPYP